MQRPGSRVVWQLLSVRAFTPRPTRAPARSGSAGSSKVALQTQFSCKVPCPFQQGLSPQCYRHPYLSMSNTGSCSGQKQASALAQSIPFRSGAGSARQGRWAVAKMQRVPRRSVPDPETLSPLHSASLSADYHAHTSDFSTMPARSKPFISQFPERVPVES